MTKLKDQAIEIILANRPRLETEGLRAIGIYGSVARGDERPGSDINLLLYPVQAEVTSQQAAHWQVLLSELLRPLDRVIDAVPYQLLSQQIFEAALADLVKVYSNRRVIAIERLPAEFIAELERSAAEMMASPAGQMEQLIEGAKDRLRSLGIAWVHVMPNDDSLVLDLLIEPIAEPVSDEQLSSWSRALSKVVGQPVKLRRRKWPGGDESIHAPIRSAK